MAKRFYFGAPRPSTQRQQQTADCRSPFYASSLYPRYFLRQSPRIKRYVMKWAKNSHKMARHKEFVIHGRYNLRQKCVFKASNIRLLLQLVSGQLSGVCGLATHVQYCGSTPHDQRIRCRKLRQQRSPDQQENVSDEYSDHPTGRAGEER